MPHRPRWRSRTGSNRHLRGAFARETVSFRYQRWGEANLVAVERAFWERNSGLVELECFSLPGDSYGNG